MIIFCTGCGNMLQKKFREKVKVEGIDYFKCAFCGKLNPLLDDEKNTIPMKQTASHLNY